MIHVQKRVHIQIADTYTYRDTDTYTDTYTDTDADADAVSTSRVVFRMPRSSRPYHLLPLLQYYQVDSSVYTCNIHLGSALV